MRASIIIFIACTTLTGTKSQNEGSQAFSYIQQEFGNPEGGRSVEVEDSQRSSEIEGESLERSQIEEKGPQRFDESDRRKRQWSGGWVASPFSGGGSPYSFAPLEVRQPVIGTQITRTVATQPLVGTAITRTVSSQPVIGTAVTQTVSSQPIAGTAVTRTVEAQPPVAVQSVPINPPPPVPVQTVTVNNAPVPAQAVPVNPPVAIQSVPVSPPIHPVQSVPVSPPVPVQAVPVRRVQPVAANPAINVQRVVVSRPVPTAVGTAQSIVWQATPDYTYHLHQRFPYYYVPTSNSIVPPSGGVLVG